ncbi:MAG: hypothetical protein ABIJ41_04145 [Candidatus Omnitrophota bacterium]
MIKKISPSQKKIIYSTGAGLVVFLLAWGFFYVPVKRRLRELKADYDQTLSHIQRIESIFGGSENMNEGLSRIEERRRELDAKFPLKEEEALKMLSDFARDLNMEMISIEPQPKTIFLDKNGSEVSIEGKTVKKVFVSLSMKGGFRECVGYLEMLKESLQAFVTIESLDVQKSGSGSAKLVINLDLNIYLLS